MFDFIFEKLSKQSWKSEFQHLTRYKLTKERSLDPCEEGLESHLFRPSLLFTVGGRGRRFSLLGDQPPKTSRVQTIFQGILFVMPSLWMDIHLEIWNNDILRPELPLSLFNSNLCRVYTTVWVLKMELGASSQKLELIQRGIKTWYMREKIWRRGDHLLGLSAVSVRPLYQLERKTSPNKGIHPAYQGYSSEIPSQKILFPRH